MPAWGPIIGHKGVEQVTHYVRSLSGLETGADKSTLASGQTIFETTCAVCHGSDGTGNKALGRTQSDQ